jgi:hypothetical protein
MMGTRIELGTFEGQPPQAGTQVSEGAVIVSTTSPGERLAKRALLWLDAVVRAGAGAPEAEMRDGAWLRSVGAHRHAILRVGVQRREAPHQRRLGGCG